MSVSELEKVLANDKRTFPDNPDVWLKDLASLINLRLDSVPVVNPPFEGKSPGMWASRVDSVDTANATDTDTWHQSQFSRNIFWGPCPLN